MPDQHTNRMLNEALVIVYRSLPMYLGHAAPWVAYGNEEAQRVLDRIVADQKEFVHRLSALLDERRHTTDLGEFPMEFTDLHDLSLGFLVKRLVAYQKRDIELLESCARRLADDAEGQSLVEEVLDASRGHTEALESLDGQPAALS